MLSYTITYDPFCCSGFTGHEHLYAFGLINMNGRMYDPLLSSFLSPDNYMQDPTTQQGFNRYAYCMYNPLKYVDPSGELCRGWGSSTYYLEMAFKNMMKERYSQYLELMEMTLNHINEMIDGLFSMGDNTGGMLGENHGCGGGSVEVKALGNGKYKVVKGLYDGGNTVYIVDEQGNRTGILGYSLTSYSFYYENGNVAKDAIIDVNNHMGQDFWDFFTSYMPGIDSYITSMLVGDLESLISKINTSPYNFKAMGFINGNFSLYSHRGMPIDFGNGFTYITTARDIGDVYAGFIFGYYGWSYESTRKGFDWFNGGPEPPVSKLPQDYGYNLGKYYYNIRKHP